jgi:hypothetical protein
MAQNLSEMVPKNKPFTFEGLDIRPSFRANDAGAHTYSVNIMVTEEQWNALKTIPRHRMIGGVLYWYDDADELPANPEIPAAATESKSKKRREPKGEWGFYWQQMHKPDTLGCNFTTFPDLQECLDVDADHVHDALRERLKVDSLTVVSPAQFEQFVKDNGLSEGLITMSRNAEVKAAEKAQAHIAEVQQN